MLYKVRKLLQTNLLYCCQLTKEKKDAKIPQVGTHGRLNAARLGNSYKFKIFAKNLQNSLKEFELKYTNFLNKTDRKFEDNLKKNLKYNKPLVTKFGTFDRKFEEYNNKFKELELLHNQMQSVPDGKFGTYEYIWLEI